MAAAAAAAGSHADSDPWAGELRTAAFRQAVAGEFLASLLLLYITEGTIIYSQDNGGIGVESQLQIATCVGLTVTVLIFIFAGVSGAHFNSCFSYACALAGKISWQRAAAFSLAQVAGMVTGTALIRIGSPALFARAGGAANLVQPGFSQLQALGAEVFITLYVFTLCFACMDTGRHAPVARGGSGATWVPQTAPIVAGMAVTSALFLAVPISSGCLNSSRALAVAIVSGNGWEDLWVFIVGPYTGATLAVIMYCSLFAFPDWHAQFCAAVGCPLRGGAGAGNTISETAAGKSVAADDGDDARRGGGIVAPLL